MVDPKCKISLSEEVSGSKENSPPQPDFEEFTYESTA
jgi:hypothetical protein